MKKIQTLFIMIICFTISATAQTLIRKNKYELTTNSDSTSNLLISKGRVLNFTMIIDNQEAINVIPIFSTKTFELKNIPKGDHSITFIRPKSWPLKDSMNYTYQFTADGTKNRIKTSFPKMRFNNTVQSTRAFIYSLGIATVTAIIIIVSDWNQG